MTESVGETRPVRPMKWDAALLNDLVKASHRNHNTIRTQVKLLGETLHIEVPSPPFPHCLAHHIDLTSSMMKRKHCLAKNCSHLVYVREIYRWE